MLRFWILLLYNVLKILILLLCIFAIIIFYIIQKIIAINLKIAHSIKCYVRLGCNITEGEDIENAVKDLCGTSICHIEPNRENQNKKFSTLAGISGLNEWTWPVEGSHAGFIQARALPNIGEWKNYSPNQIKKIAKTEINKPQPLISEPTKAKTSWTVPAINTGIVNLF